MVLIAYGGDASWTGYELISGRWYAAPGEVVVSSRLLTVTGAAIGASPRQCTPLPSKPLFRTKLVFG